MTAKTDIFVKEVKEALEEGILNFWAKLKDPNGGFFCQLDKEGNIQKESEKEALLTAKTLWAFSKSYNHSKKKEYLLNAIVAKDFFLDHFIDHKFGGAYFSVNRNGEKVDTKTDLYVQSMAILGLTEFYLATKEDGALKEARNIYNIIEKEFKDKEHNGYLSVLSRDFQAIDCQYEKTTESHIALLEAYTNLYKCCDCEDVKEAILNLLRLIQNNIFAKSEDGLEPYFKKDWSIIEGKKLSKLDLKAAWLILESAFALKDIDLVNELRPLALELHKIGIKNMKKSCAQAEAVTASLRLWKYAGLAEGTDIALQVWADLKDRFVSYKEECPCLTEKSKSDLWIHPYHNTRMCLEVLKLFS